MSSDRGFPCSPISSVSHSRTVEMDESSTKLALIPLKCDMETSDAETTTSEESETLGNKLQLVRSMQSQILVTIQDVSARLLQNPLSQDLWQLLLTLSHCGCEQVAFEQVIRSTDLTNQPESIESQAHRVDAMLDQVLTLGSRSPSPSPKRLFNPKRQRNSRRLSLNNTTSKSMKNRKATPRSKHVLDGEYYYVEKILDKKILSGKAYYFVKWIGYPNTKNTWEPRESFLSQDFVDEYEKKSRSRKLGNQRRKTIGATVAVKKPLQPLEHYASRADNSSKMSPTPSCDDNNRRSTRLLRKSMHID